jgi:hypothetical protein
MGHMGAVTVRIYYRYPLSVPSSPTFIRYLHVQGSIALDYLVPTQVLTVKHNHNLLINIIPLISYMLTATNKRITHIRESRQFESMYTL